MTKADFIAWAEANGYKPDRYGHYQKPGLASGAMTRLKLSSVAVRLEVQGKVGGKNEWIRLRSGYYSKLSVSTDGRIKGMAR